MSAAGSEMGDDNDVAMISTEEQVQMILPEYTLTDMEDITKRYYSAQIEAPPSLSMYLAFLAKQVWLSRPTDLTTFARQFFHTLQQHSNQQPKQQLEQWLASIQTALQQQLQQQLQDKLRPRSASNTEEFSEPAGLRSLMLNFAREFIRYSPDNEVQFACDYFTALQQGEQELKHFLIQQAEQRQDKWEAIQQETKQQEK